MARPLRIEYPNAFYHVVSRGNNRQEIYLDDDDYGMFLETLKECSKLFGVRTLAFALMPNHYHLLLTTPKANLSRAMRHLNGVYTQRFNRRHKKDGHLFRGRFKAILVQEDEYLTHLIRYIHLNPTNPTSKLKDYPWTSHKQYLKAQDEKPWLCVRLGLSFFAHKTNQALKAYRQFIDQGVDPKTMDFYAKKYQNSILGNQDFLDHIKENYLFKNQKLQTEIPEQRKMGGQAIADRVVREGSRAFDKPKDSLYHSRRGEHHPARMIALSLTRQLSGLTLPEVAEVFQANSYKTVGTACYRTKIRIAKEPELKRRYDGLYRRCSQEET